MFNRLLPPRVDNTFRGHKLALVLFGLLLFLKVIISLNSILNGDLVAIGDGIPLDTFPTAAAQAYVSLFALFGLSQFMLCLLCIFALVRYRALVPLMLALLVLEFLGRRLIFQFMPLERTGTLVASIINLVLLALMLVGLALSLWSQRQPLVQTVTRD
ncbi:hypothetical protein ANRL1_03939 [Anaerolineae bacterium]|nr:hypothetical protein ANRL1_03939 [Anaerolineae bacterium]